MVLAVTELFLNIDVNRVPTRTGKPEKWEGIFQSGKVREFWKDMEKSGKITQSTGKFREFQKNIF